MAYEAINRNIKHTEGAEIPETRFGRQAASKIRSMREGEGRSALLIPLGLLAVAGIAYFVMRRYSSEDLNEMFSNVKDRFNNLRSLVTEEAEGSFEHARSRTGSQRR